MTRWLRAAGVTLVAGSDAGIFTNVPGLSLVEELELMVAAGLTPFDALKAATDAPAQVLGRKGLDGCALGGWLSKADLTALRDSARNHNLERTQENVLGGLAAQGVDITALGLN